MQTVSSASRTCIASASAVEWTATVLMPISWQARWMRSAISPRLAISSFLICIGRLSRGSRAADRTRPAGRPKIMIFLTTPPAGAVIGFITFIASTMSKRVPSLHGLADLDERLGAGLGRQIGGADHRRLDAFASDLFLARLADVFLGVHRRGASAGAATAAAAQAERDQRRRPRADLDPAIAVLDLDLGQFVVGEQLAQARARAPDRCALRLCRRSLRDPSVGPLYFLLSAWRMRSVRRCGVRPP